MVAKGHFRITQKPTKDGGLEIRFGKNTHLIGDVFVTHMVAEYTKRGNFAIRVPEQPFDILVVSSYDGNTTKVQVKVIHPSEDGEKLMVSWDNDYDETVVDVFAFVCPELNTWYEVPISVLGGKKKGITLRFLPAKNGQRKNINWAKEYEQQFTPLSDFTK